MWRRVPIMTKNFPVTVKNELKTGTLPVTVRGTWCYRTSAMTGWPGVSLLGLGEIVTLICNFCLSVAACTIV